MFIAMPLGFRLGWLFVLGTFIGSFLNVCVFRLQVEESILGRSRCRSCGKMVSWRDNIPILSWFLLGGRCRHCQERFSFRYPLVELICGCVFAGLYYWEVVQRGQIPPDVMLPVAGPVFQEWLHVRYLGHLLLFSLMLTASLIDLDITVIPDSVTIPGVLAGLALAVAYPPSLMPDWGFPPGAGFAAPQMHLSDPPFLLLHRPWPPVFDPREPTALAIGIAAFTLWCLALLPWHWRMNWGLRWALWILFWRIVGTLNTYLLLALAVAGSLAISCVWWQGDERWMALMTSLGGLVCGGGMIWSVRIVGRLAMGREAMGFGDVTLMAMIGCYLGWQPVLILFFVAPFFGLAAAVFQFIFRGDNEIPYGPFLCLGTATVVIRWSTMWDRIAPVFGGMGPLIPIMMALCLLLMFPLLLIVRFIRRLAEGGRTRNPGSQAGS